MKRILFLALALGNWMAQAATVQIVDGSTRSKTIRVMKVGQRIEISGVEVQLEIGAPGAESAKADILMLHDPQTGLFLWRYQDSDPAKPGGIIERFEQDSAIVVKDDRLVEFLLLGSSLWVRESREKFSTMADGQRALMIQIQRFGDTIRNVMLRSYQEINLASALDADFRYQRGNPDPSHGMKLREVSASDSEWRVVLDGPNGDAKAVTIGLGKEIKAVAPVGPAVPTP